MLFSQKKHSKVAKKKENRNIKMCEALKDNGDNEKCENKTEVETEGNKLIEETKRNKKN